MTIEELAKGIIEILHADETKENIEGITIILEALKNSVNDNWEQFITKKTNETLAFDVIKCECGRDLHITRDRSAISVEMM